MRKRILSYIIQFISINESTWNKYFLIREKFHDLRDFAKRFRGRDVNGSSNLSVIADSFCLPGLRNGNKLSSRYQAKNATEWVTRLCH